MPTCSGDGATEGRLDCRHSSSAQVDGRLSNEEGWVLGVEEADLGGLPWATKRSRRYRPLPLPVRVLLLALALGAGVQRRWCHGGPTRLRTLLRWLGGTTISVARPHIGARRLPARRSTPDSCRRRQEKCGGRESRIWEEVRWRELERLGRILFPTNACSTGTIRSTAADLQYKSTSSTSNSRKKVGTFLNVDAGWEDL